MGRPADEGCAAPQTPFFLVTDADTFFLSEMQTMDLMLQEDFTGSGVTDLPKQACPN